MPGIEVLFNYGVLGIIVAFGFPFVRNLINKAQERADEQVRIEQERASRNEEEVRRLNEIIQEKYIPQLFLATQVLKESQDVLKDAVDVIAEFRKEQVERLRQQEIERAAQQLAEREGRARNGINNEPR